jgi:hypothetical protein
VLSSFARRGIVIGCDREQREQQSVDWRMTLTPLLRRRGIGGMDQQVPTDVARRWNSWRIGAHVNRAAWSLLIVAGIGAGLYISTFNPQPPLSQILGLGAAAAAALNAQFDPRGHADKFLRAWRLLDSACRRYRQSGNPDRAGLDEAIDAGEVIIGPSSPSSPNAT